MRKLVLFIFIFSSIFTAALTQNFSYRFQPGFNARECDDLLNLNHTFLDTTNNRFINYLPGYTFIYRSPNMGLDNAWDLWIRNDSTVIFLLRGTVANAESVLADFFCAMLPAQGKLIMAPNDTLNYQLAADNRAAVHAGFLIGFGFLSKDILPKLDSLYKNGYYNYLVSGHSQGAALSYYISAWMLYLKKNGIYPFLNIKTYASAPPKTGNMYFAYDYDNITRAEWTYSVINTADPIPEMPFTTQQPDVDMNSPNPIFDLKKKIDSMSLAKRIVLNHAFNRMRETARHSSETYQEYLGGYSMKYVRKLLPQVVIPETVNTTYFVTPGVHIVLSADDNYHRYIDSVQNFPYYDHTIAAYRYLLREYYEGLDKLNE